MLVAPSAKPLVPIRQTNRRAEHAAGRRAINQETFNLSRPGGGGRAQLKQALAYDNKLISHFYHFGSNHKDITLLKTDVDCGCFECFLGSAYGCRRVRGFSVLSALPLGGANGSIYTISVCIHVTMGFWA
jgi:hypothetical protein